MLNQGMLELASQVLDRQLVDADEVPCGKVDDLKLSDAQPGASPFVVAILVGPGAASDRLPALPRILVRALRGSWSVRIPWSDVREIRNQVKLSSKASELGLNEERTLAYRLITKLPGSWTD